MCEAKNRVSEKNQEIESKSGETQSKNWGKIKPTNFCVLWKSQFTSILTDFYLILQIFSDDFGAIPNWTGIGERPGGPSRNVWVRYTRIKNNLCNVFSFKSSDWILFFFNAHSEPLEVTINNLGHGFFLQMTAQDKCGTEKKVEKNFSRAPVSSFLSFPTSICHV